MFWHNFKYSIKVLLRSRMLLFWTFAFPILLSIFFNMAFSDIEKKEKLDIIDIAIVENKTFKDDEIFKEAFESLSDKENEDRLFNIKYTDLNEAKELLAEEEITGYLLFGDDVDIFINTSGVEETILRFVVDEISSNKEIIETLSENKIEKQLKSGNLMVNPEEIYNDVIELVNTDTVRIKDISNDNLSYTMLEYYTLIAMAALYGGMLSMRVTNFKLANMNSVGKRTSISPINKAKTILGSLLASYIVQLIGLAILFVFTIFVLNIDYGDDLAMIILLACCGSLAGLSIGIAIAALAKTNENTKTGILISVTMVGCFLSGMMGMTMKYVIDTNIPILNKINPASMITDGFYSLYYYDTMDRFYYDVKSLLVFSVIMIIISYFGLRGQKYDSI